MRPAATHRLPGRARKGVAITAALAVAAGFVVTGSAWLIPALPGLGADSASAAQSPTSCNSTVALTNGGFEQPLVAANQFAYLKQATVPGWNTTASDGNIEIWHNSHLGVPASAGVQHAELNATQASTLYQDVPTTPGQNLRWQLDHRGRDGTDVMRVQIGSPTGTLVSQGNLSDGNTAWGTHAGLYTVPAGQTTTRFAFTAVSTATGNRSQGNFLDAISFGTGPCLVTTESVTNASGATTAKVGDTLTYTVNTTNGGGNNANNSVITDQLPANVEFVPGSIRYGNGSSTATSTDAAGDDVGEYDASTRSVRVRVGTGASAITGGAVAPGESASISYQVRVLLASAGSTISDDSGVSFVDDLNGGTSSSTSNTVSTPVATATDLAVAQTQTTQPLVAGRPATYTVTVTNNGPQPDTGVSLTTSLPPLSGITATPGAGMGTCSISAGTLTCLPGSLASGASATVTITGTVPSSTAPGTAFALSSTVAGDVVDPVTTNNTASLSDSTTAQADLRVALTSTPTNPTAGTNVTYTARVTNDGPSTARTVTFTDPIATGDTFVSASSPAGPCTYSTTNRTVSCALADLASGDSADVTIVTTLDPANNGNVNNTVQVSSQTPDPTLANNTASITAPGSANADVSVVLTLDKTTFYPGQSGGYTLVVKNNGPSTATNVSFNTIVPAGITINRPASSICTPSACTIPSLAPGQTVTISGTADSSNDIEEGSYQASTTVITPTNDTDPTNNSSSVDFDVVLNADVKIAQTVVNATDPGQPLVAGQGVRTTITVTNDGPTRAEGLVLNQTIPVGQTLPSANAGAGSCTFTGQTNSNNVVTVAGVLVCTLDKLENGGTWTVVLTATLDPSFAGDSLTRTRTVSTASPDPVLANNTSTIMVPVSHVADIAVTQTTSTPTVVQTDEVRFRITVTNNGPSDTHDVLVREQPLPGVLVTSGTPSVGTYDAATGNWSIPTLALGQSVTLDIVGTAQASGSVTNQATFLSSAYPDPRSTNDSASTTVTVIAASESLSIVPTATVSPAADQNGARVGDLVSYTYLVTNTGNVRMTDVAVSDPLLGPAATFSCDATSLAPGASTTCRTAATYAVTQDLFDQGGTIDDNASVVGTPTGSTDPQTFGPESDPVPFAATSPGLTGTKIANWNDADNDGALDVGETIKWTVRAVNTGDVTLTQVRIDDPTAGTFTCAVTTLAPGADTTCTAPTYTVTQADVNAGQRVNTATARASNVRNSATVSSASSTTTTPSAANPKLAVSVQGVVAPAADQAAAKLGDTITWTYTVTNTGNVPVNGVGIVDPDGGTITCQTTTLQAGASTTCTGSQLHTVTQADLLARGVTNDASATGTSVVGGTRVNSPSASTTVPVEAVVGSLTIAPTATVQPAADQNAAKVGDVIGYSYLVTNNGNLSVNAITMSDALLPGASFACGATSLAPGASTTCTTASTYAVTQGDFNAGDPIRDQASVTGTPNGATSPASFGPATDPVPLAATNPSLSAQKTANWNDADNDGALDAGETIDWSVRVVNTGDVRLTGISVVDPIAGTFTCPVTVLGPTDTTTCTAATYTVTAADANAGTKTNTATVDAVDARTGASVSSPPTSTTTPANPTPALAIALDGVVNPAGHQGAAEPGDTVTWKYTVSNTGNVPVTGIGVDDPEGGTITCLATRLAPGESTTCTGSRAHTVDEADILARGVTNSASATGTSVVGGTAVTSAPDTDTVPVVAIVGSLSVVPTATVTPAGHQNAAEVGDLIGYSYLVTNDGNVTMSAIQVTDSFLATGATFSCLATSLAPGATTTCTTGATHAVTQDEFDQAGPINDAAGVSGVPAGSTTRAGFGPASDPVPLAATAAALSATKIANWSDTDLDGALDVGETIAWSVRVLNTGDVTVTGVAISDPTAGTFTCAVRRLAPGEATTCTAASYTVTSADVANGVKTNTATASGDNARTGGTVTSPATSTTTPSTPAPALAITLRGVVDPAADQAGAKPGDTVTWTYTVTNTGNVTVNAIGVDDPEGGTITCLAASLAPGETTTCVGSTRRPVTENDVFARGIANAAAATGTSSVGGGPVRSTSATTTVPVVAPSAGISLTSMITNMTRFGMTPVPGDELEVTYLVTNTGVVTLSGVTVTDPTFGPVTCPSATLAPGASMTCSAANRHVVTQADADRGTLVSNAVTSGTPPNGLPVVSASAVASVPIAEPAGTTTPVTSTGTTTNQGTQGTTATDSTESGDLPSTGAPAGIIWMILMGLFLVAVGGVVVGSSRRSGGATR